MNKSGDGKNYGTVEYEKLGEKEQKKDEKEEKKEEVKPSVSYFSLFRFADWIDKLLLFFGILCALIHGALTPLFPILFGDVIDAFNPENPPEEIQAIINEKCLAFLVLGGIAFTVSYAQLSFLMLTSQRQSNRIRKLYFRSLFRQEIGWYDKQDSGQIITHIAGDVLLIQEGIGDKLGSFFQFLSMFISGFVVGFIKGWEMSLVILSVTPILMICGAFIGKLMTEFTTKGQQAYAEAGGIAEEVISCIRTVAAFSGENSEIRRYTEKITNALKQGEKRGHMAGLGLGITFFVMFSSYGLAFWYGAKLLGEGKMEAGDVTTVFFAIIMGAMALGQATPNLSNFSTAKGAAFHVFEVIERIPEIDSLEETGRILDRLRGNIIFDNVKFTYPSRPDYQVLKGVSFEVKQGQTVALVGASGCGKSTIISLTQRFYDTESGTITIDGYNVKDFNSKWLRSQIGVVSQEPILFAKTIGENISLGRDNVTQEEIEEAAKKANAHNFIVKLPLGYNTLVGERGAQLSGGQKQRVAIARAIIRDPKLLLLDEATSALDTESEKVVQQALDVASEGRTTIIVAHRLSTIRNADVILVFDQGQIVEKGNHEELMEKQGVYFALVERQLVSTEEKENKSEQEEKRKSFERKSTKPVDGKEEIEAKDVSTSGVYWRAMKLASPETFFIIIGIIAAIGSGIVFPLFSLVFSEMLNDLLMLTGDELKEAVRFWALAFLGLGLLTGITNYLQPSMFGISGERLTFRLRKMLFVAIVRQNIGWFDDKANSTGILATKLSNDATLVKSATGERLGTIFQIFATIIGGLGIALTACWQLTLVICAVVPLIAISGAMEMKMMMGFANEVKKAYESSGHVATEAIENIRTVLALGKMETFIDDYNVALLAPTKQGTKKAWISGIGYGFGEMMTFLIWALAFWYGAILVIDGKTDFAGMMKAISAIVFGATMLGQMASFTPDLAKAKIAAASLFQIIDRVPPIDNSSLEGTRLESVRGDVKFENVQFSYPTRSDVKVLKGISLSVKSGETLALVGSSGCGKSTVVSLLERFYEIEGGNIQLDGYNIASMNISWLRNQFGIVGQEPVLFATTIRENIAYGKPGATEEEIIAAATSANAHSFISTLPDKYDTFVGEKGTQLSGGQKQRVAIARAIIRNPKILLLDEATSALDSESEKIVQEALDRAREGRTTIVIAHRLSTIQNASKIAVIDSGNVVETGTHSELLKEKGLYYNLVQTQVNPL